MQTQRLLLSLGLIATAAALDISAEKQKQEAELDERSQSWTIQHLTTEAQSMMQKTIAHLEYFMTEEGQVKHSLAIEKLKHQYVKDAEDLEEWHNQVAKDGVFDFGEVKLPAIEAHKPIPLELPEEKEDQKKFMEYYGMDGGTFSILQNIHAEKNKARSHGSAFLQKMEEAEQGMTTKAQDVQLQDKALEMIRAAPKGFKKALKTWEGLVPKAAMLLLQTGDASTVDEAKTLGQQASQLHKQLYDEVKADSSNSAALMSIAQNRITALLARQAVETDSNIQPFENCSANSAEIHDAESRCLCLVDNICAHASVKSDACSVVSQTTCTGGPQTLAEEIEMKTV